MYTKICHILVFTFALSGCVSAKVWVLERRDNHVIIAYENYDPSSDNNKKIKQLIPCKKFRMVANPVYNTGYVPPSYYVSNNYITPIGGGYTQRGEYHYECL